MAVLTHPAPSEVCVSAPVAPAVEFDGVSKVYPGSLFWRRPIQAVSDVSLRIEAGEIFGLIGPNRAGKTTLVKLLLSLCQPTAGTIQRLGRPLSDRSTLGQVGYVHENHAFPRYLSAEELLHYYGALSLIPYEVLQGRVPQLLERVGLADRSKEPIARFSKGMVQRLGVAQALINAPRLLVLDEPTEGLDLAGRELLRNVMAEVRQQGGSVLLVSHALTEVEQVCDRVGVLVNGRLVHVGPLDELTCPVKDAQPRSLEAALQELYQRA
jgi:ABC-2 type transport system ATP-binding protein